MRRRRKGVRKALREVKKSKQVEEILTNLSLFFCSFSFQSFFLGFSCLVAAKVFVCHAKLSPLCGAKPLRYESYLALQRQRSGKGHPGLWKLLTVSSGSRRNAHTRCSCKAMSAYKSSNESASRGSLPTIAPSTMSYSISVLRHTCSPMAAS